MTRRSAVASSSASLNSRSALNVAASSTLAPLARGRHGQACEDALCNLQRGGESILLSLEFRPALALVTPALTLIRPPPEPVGAQRQRAGSRSPPHLSPQ